MNAFRSTGGLSEIRSLCPFFVEVVVVFLRFAAGVLVLFAVVAFETTDSVSEPSPEGGGEAVPPPPPLVVVVALACASSIAARFCLTDITVLAFSKTKRDKGGLKTI